MKQCYWKNTLGHTTTERLIHEVTPEK